MLPIAVNRRYVAVAVHHASCSSVLTFGGCDSIGTASPNHLHRHVHAVHHAPDRRSHSPPSPSTSLTTSPSAPSAGSARSASSGAGSWAMVTAMAGWTGFGCGRLILMSTRDCCGPLQVGKNSAGPTHRVRRARACTPTLSGQRVEEVDVRLHRTVEAGHLRIGGLDQEILVRRVCAGSMAEPELACRQLERRAGERDARP